VNKPGNVPKYLVAFPELYFALNYDACASIDQTELENTSNFVEVIFQIASQENIRI
jgi:hypothetical protein